VKYKGYSLADLLDATVEESVGHPREIPQIAAKLKTLNEWASDTFTAAIVPPLCRSGGSAAHQVDQRSKRNRRVALYLLDAPTTGLHFEPMSASCSKYYSAGGHGQTTGLIEHNMDCDQDADWLIDLGPDGGELRQARVVATGTTRSR